MQGGDFISVVETKGNLEKPLGSHMFKWKEMPDIPWYISNQWNEEVQMNVPWNLNEKCCQAVRKISQSYSKIYI